MDTLRRANNRAIEHGHGRGLSPAEWAALGMVAIKLSRIVSGSTVHSDNYIDAAAYCAIAGEAAINQ